MVEDNLDGYRKANQDLYDRTAEQYRIACQNPDFKGTHSGRVWRKELKERMKLLDFRFKGLGEE